MTGTFGKGVGVGGVTALWHWDFPVIPAWQVHLVRGVGGHCFVALGFSSDTCMASTFGKGGGGSLLCGTGIFQ